MPARVTGSRCQMARSPALSLMLSGRRGGAGRAPPQPLTSSFDGADAVLRQLGWTAVMFVDVGNVTERTRGYASWARLGAAQLSGRWELQLHAGRGHHNIRYDPAGTMGPFYAYLVEGKVPTGEVDC